MPADVLIVTVTKVESEAVLLVFSQATGQSATREERDGKMYRNLGVVKGASIFMVRSEMGAGGLGAAQQMVDKGIASLSPTAVIMVGIAFGVDDKKQTMGDILVSQQFMLYDLQRVGTGTDGKVRIGPRGDRPHASARLLDRLRSADEEWSDEKAKVHFGLVLSGEKLVDNFDFREQIRRLEPEAIGGEMEGAGLYTAGQDRKVDWILVKGICDWADGHKEENRNERQRLAAHNAATFVLQMLEQAPLTRNAEPTTKLPSPPSVTSVPASVAKHASVDSVVCTVCGERPGMTGWCLGGGNHGFKQFGAPADGIFCTECGEGPAVTKWCLGGGHHSFKQFGKPGSQVYCPSCGQHPGTRRWCSGGGGHKFLAS